MSEIITPAAREYYVIETSTTGRRWKAIPGAIFRVRFADGAPCHYAAGDAKAAAEDAIRRLQADPDLGQDFYRLASR
ncbi:hypothetical protein NTR1_16 [Nocardia phage NTR1]|nr:hypothetical protein NTR1_16 [Nocardia phage NTR1]